LSKSVTIYIYIYIYMHIEMIEVKAFRTFIRIYSLLKISV
jgi:hypothetical protein